jgi:hypothetical protein
MKIFMKFFVTFEAALFEAKAEGLKINEPTEG